jgi:hypothetical protein
MVRSVFALLTTTWTRDLSLLAQGASGWNCNDRLDETLAMISMEIPNEEQIQMLSKGMELLVGVLGNVVMGIGLERH